MADTRTSTGLREPFWVNYSAPFGDEATATLEGYRRQYDDLAARYRELAEKQTHPASQQYFEGLAKALAQVAKDLIDPTLRRANRYEGAPKP